MRLRDWIIGAVAAIGAFLSIYNFFVARRKDARDRREKEEAEREEAAMWRLYARFLDASKEGLILRPEVGTAEFIRAEKLAERGLLERLPKGMGYSIAGQQFKISG